MLLHNAFDVRKEIVPVQPFCVSIVLALHRRVTKSGGAYLLSIPNMMSARLAGLNEIEYRYDDLVNLVESRILE
jgi:hypothetical protein